MAVCILYSITLYGIQEIIDGEVSFRPKGWQYDERAKLSR